MAVDSLGDIYVAATVGTLPAFSKLYAIKYHKNGTPIPDTLWSTTFDAGSAKTSGAVAMAVDATGSLFISGWRDYAGVKKIVTMKISQKTGRLLWNREWSGVIGNNSMATSIGLADLEVITAAWTDRTQPLDGGTLAATAGSKTHLQNSDKVWSTNQWAGYSLYMVSSQNKDVFRRIQSNDSTTLYLAPAEALPYAVVPGDLYYIYDKDDIDLLVIRQEKGILDPPSGLYTEVLSNSSVRLTFQDNSETETRFSIDVKIGENGTWTNNAYTIDSLDQAGMNSVALELSGLLADTEYYFRVRAFADIADSGYSGEEVVALTRVVSFSSPTLTYSHADIAGGDDQATDVACYGGGALVVTGTVFSDQNGFSSPSKDYYTVKLHRNTFDVIWKDQRDGGYAEDDEIVALAVDPQLETVVTGTSMQNISGAGIIPSVWTLKYAFSPTLDGLGEAEPMWTNQLNGSGRMADQSDVVAVQEVSPYAIGVAGHGHADLNNINVFVRKLSASGTVQFTTEQDFGGNEYPAAAAVDALGNVLIAGHVEKTTGNSWIVAKFDAVSGAMTWSDTYGDTGDNRALSLAVDANNDVYVTGYITDSATGYTRMTTIKYLGETVGTADRIWTSIYPPELPGTSFAARKITYDTFANELIIAGDGYVYLTDRDLILLRYSTAGTLIKQVELRNPGSDEIVTGVAIDPSGYIYISADSGASPNTNIIATIYTESLNYIKSFLYNGVANKNDHATAIAANKFGQGFIAGYTTSAAGNKDFLAFRIENDQTIMPFGALATPQADFSKVVISWSNVTSGTTPYIKRRNPDTGAWEPPPGTANGQLPVDAALFTDTVLDPNTPYCWRVYADSVTLRYAEACTTTTITSPVLSSYSNITTSSATVHWTNISGNTGYLLERKTDEVGTWQTITTLPANTILFDDPGLASGVTYYYRLSGQNAGGFSLPSAEFMVPTMPKTIVNGWYQNYSPSPTTIIVRSSGPPSPITSLRVERKTGAGGTWSTVGSADATCVSI